MNHSRQSVRQSSTPSTSQGSSQTTLSSLLGNSRFWGIVGVIAVAAALRLVPHPANFSPIAAMALFSGALLPRRAWAFAIPLAAMLLSDLAIGFHELMPAVYVSFALISAMGLWLNRERSTARVAGTTIAGSLVFFFVTNFAVWAQTSLYEKTAAGLLSCFVAALPFLQNSLAGDLFYSTVLFGAWAMAARAIPDWRIDPELA